MPSEEITAQFTRLSDKMGELTLSLNEAKKRRKNIDKRLNKELDKMSKYQTEFNSFLMIVLNFQNRLGELKKSNSKLLLYNFVLCFLNILLLSLFVT